MKKILIFAIILLSFICGCDSNSTTKSTSTNTSTSIITKEYNISWISDGKLIKTDKVKEGQLPQYTGNTPTKDSTQEFSYTFKGWDKEITKASMDTEYNAVFDEVINQYTISFNTNDGSNIDPITANYGTAINKPDDPTKEGYKFVGWCTDETLTTEVTWPINLHKDQILYAKWNEKLDILKYLKSLLESYNINPLTELPEGMILSENNIIDANTAYDFSKFTNISSIKYGGYGKQWNMVLDNLLQSQMFYNTLSIIDGISSTAIAGFNNYLDKNTSDTANYTFLDGIYECMIKYEDNILDFVISYTANIIALGEQKVEIALSYDIANNKKATRIQFGEANALRYELSENKYSFAIKYLGVRRAYFSLEKDENDNILGTITEYLGVSSAQIKSFAHFKITDNYTLCTGNKADGMIGFTGTICELYDTDSGKLLAYEVNEVLSNIEYNTLWFNLDDTSGITNIKAIEEKNSNNPHTIYINNSNNIFKTENYGGINLKTASRRYDIELRSQYFYYLDENEEYKQIECQIPMLFIQEEKLEDLAKDINSNNNISFTLNVNESIINYLTNEYSLAIKLFNEIKEKYSIDYILEFIA